MKEGFGEVAERLRRSTVHVERSGSGVIWDGAGLIITNAHVARAPKLRVDLWDGRSFEGDGVARDPRRDLASLRIDASGLPAVTAADSAALRVGELVMAVGNPLGFVGALTTGVVHAMTRRWVHADVRLAPGNSGGPLADARGRVIGINTMIAGGLALAIPSDVVRNFLSAGPSDAWLGVTVRPVRVPRSNAAHASSHTFGLMVLEVEPRSPASSASLLPGDILLGTEQEAFTLLADLWQVLEGSGPRLVRLEFLRGDYSRVRCVTVQLGVLNASRSFAAA